MDFGHEGTCGVNYPQPSTRAVLTDFGRDSVSAVDDPFSVGNLILAVDEDRPFAPQILDYEAVVDDFFAHVNRGAEGLQSDANHVDGPHHARAEATGLKQQQGFFVRLSESSSHDVSP